MPDNRDEELKGWPESWYKDGNVNGILRCPVDECNEIFTTAGEVRNLLNHAIKDNQNMDMKFRHLVLQEMFNVTKCPKCPQPYEFEFDSLPEVRELFDHERDEHKSEDLSDVNKFIGLIREYREKEFGGGLEIWPKLHEYYTRRIRKQTGYLVFQKYLQDNYPFYHPPPKELYRWHFDHLAVADRKERPRVGYSEEVLKEIEFCYPVKSHEFLSSLKPPPDEPEHILNVFKKGYSEGKF